VRIVITAAVTVEGISYMRDAHASSGAVLTGLAMLIAGGLLLIGFLTPIVATVVAAGAIGVAASLLPACVPSLLDSKPTFVFALTILLTVTILGPGAFSLDARMFGRRQIFISRPNDHL
jgi:uncharacterized membrane protein YphA (DoxX/SURF4 family)